MSKCTTPQPRVLVAFDEEEDALGHEEGEADGEDVVLHLLRHVLPDIVGFRLAAVQRLDGLTFIRFCFFFFPTA